MCKEPFRRRRAEAPSPQAQPPAPSIPVRPIQPPAFPGPHSAAKASAPEPAAIPPEVLRKLSVTPEALEKMLKAEAGKAVPEVSPVMRQFAWAFFALTLMALLSLLAVMSFRAKSMEDAPIARPSH